MAAPTNPPGMLIADRFGAQKDQQSVTSDWNPLQDAIEGVPEPAVLLNLVNRAYQYEDPDHWRLPLGTDKIPYRFQP